MRNAHRWLSILVLLALCAVMPPRAIAQAPVGPSGDAGPTLEQAEEQLKAMRDRVRDPSTPPEAWGMLMMEETIVLRLRATRAAHGGPIDEAAFQADQRRMTERVFADWKAARPDDASPYLAEIQRDVPAGQVDDAILGLLPRFPDSPRLLMRVIDILPKREQTKRAEELVTQALARHPERSDLYSVAIGFYSRQNNTSRQQELAEIWIERLPEDPNALRTWLQLPGPRDPGVAMSRVERMAAAAGTSYTWVDVCGWLLTTEEGRYRDPAVRCLTAVAQKTTDAQVRLRATTVLVGAVGASGDAEAMAKAIAQLPAQSRLEAVLAAVSSLGREECAKKLALLNVLPWDGSDGGGSLVYMISALRGCETYGPARAVYLGAFARVPAGELNQLIGQWLVRVNDRYPQDYGLGPRIVAALEDRLRREPDRVEVWKALAEAYDAAGWEDRKATHLTSWLKTTLSSPSGEQIVWLSRYRLQREGPAAELEVLRSSWQASHDLTVASELADLLQATGKRDDLHALVAELARGDAPSWKSLAVLLDARSTLFEKGPEEALPKYKEYIEHPNFLQKDEALEYLVLLGGLRGAQAAEQAAQGLCRAHDNLVPGMAPVQCAASLLTEMGHAKGALKTLEAAALRAPDDLNIQSSYAYAAEQAGEVDKAEKAYRRVLALDIKSDNGWDGLARIVEHRGDTEGLEALLRQAEQARGDRPPSIVLALARAYRAHGQAARAIEVLTALRDKYPGTYIADEELTRAYLAAANESPATRVANVAPPTSDDLRAARQAEALTLGLSGHVDAAKARELVKSLAAQGNVYAIVRLAMWQHFGREGYVADPRQAARSVDPYLPALRVAAQRGDSYAQYLWGTVLLSGIGLPKQAEEGAAWLRKAADKNEPWALYNLGWMAENGEGTAKDLGEALRWYELAAKAGNPSAMTSLAALRFNGTGDLHRPAEGLAWLRQAADRGVPSAISWYAAILLYGWQSIPADPASARPWLERGVELGEQRSVYDLSIARLTGAGGPMDERGGVALLERLAAQRHARAMWQLAWQSTLGRGTPRDGKRAEDWIEQAASLSEDAPYLIGGAGETDGDLTRKYFREGVRELEQHALAGDAYAGGLLARLYYSGFGVEQDVVHALALARPAAAGGSTQAMRILGDAYRSGEGVEANAAQAAHWWGLGAEAGNSFCMMWYSQMLFRGEGGKKDMATALAWLERSGERGNAWAMNDLGRLYDNGWYGLPRDEKKAEYWWRKAYAAFGSTEAKGWLIAHGMLP